MPPENFFSAAPLDRVSLKRRDEAWLEECLSRSTTMIAPVWRSQNLVIAGDTPRAALVPVDLLREHLHHASPILLGTERDVSVFCLDLSHLDEKIEAHRIADPEGDSSQFVDLRQVGSVLSGRDGSILAYARAMVHWHRQAAFCGKCGSPNRPTQGGHVMLCRNPECAQETFPRSDPAVIMLVTAEDRALLGRQPTWPPGMYSALAGFCEPGESLENAVAREVFEETGIVVDEAHYFASQPWPFPQSLMLGFLASSEGGEPDTEADELEEARWFTREELIEAKAHRTVRVPARLSIARQLIEAWLADEPQNVSHAPHGW